jgi:hypothetical protein
MKTIFAITLSIFSCHDSIKAVAPDPGPIPFTVVSDNGQFHAVYEPGKGFKGVEQSSGKVIWKTPNYWYRSALLSDDGRKLIAFFEDGKALEAIEEIDNFTPITFFKDGKIIKKIRLRDLYSDPTTLQRRNSYYYWGDIVGFTKEGLLELRIEKKESIFFNTDTGEISQRIQIKEQAPKQ